MGSIVMSSIFVVSPSTRKHGEAYRYDVDPDGRELARGLDMLASATRIAREAARPQRPTIIRAWETIRRAKEAR